MFLRTRPLIAVVGFGALVLVCAGCARLFYHGDGAFSGPHLLRPRYVVTFPDVPLYEAGVHHFHFRGIPEEEMTLILYIKGGAVGLSDAERAPFETLGVTIDASLTDDKGNVACHALGRPSASNTDGVWVLTSGGPEAGYWHWQCNPVHLYPDRAYDLAIQLSNVDPHGKKVVVAPTLYGGGIELP